MLFHHSGQRLGIRVCKISDRADADAVELMFRRLSDKKQITHRKRPHLLRNLLRKKRMNAVRLQEIARHLRQKLVRRHTDIHRKSLLTVDLFPDPVCRLDRCPEQPLRSRHIHERLIHAELLDHIRILPQDGDKRLGLLMIHRMVRLYKCQIRALAQRIHDRLSRHNTVLLGRDRLCQDHAVPRLNISADRRRNLS